MCLTKTRDYEAKTDRRNITKPAITVKGLSEYLSDPSGQKGTTKQNHQPAGPRWRLPQVTRSNGVRTHLLTLNMAFTHVLSDKQNRKKPTTNAKPLRSDVTDNNGIKLKFSSTYCSHPVS